MPHLTVLLSRLSAGTALLLPLLSAPGCVVPRVVDNPTLVSTASHEALWERVVDVLHEYQFPIERENKLDGLIETGYKVGSGVLEPWHSDSVTLEDRMESSLQSIRRRALVRLTPAQDGYVVGVEVLKEIENPQKLIINSPGYATFRENQPIQRDLDVVIGPSTDQGWILKGRDLNLEQALMESIQKALVRP